MSSFTVCGYFGLANCRHEVLTSSSKKNTTYVVYDSSFVCADDTSSSVLIRHFSAQHAVLPDNTIAFIIGKAGFPSALAQPIVLHALHFFAIPGDPTSSSYEDSTPDMLNPIAFIIGHVASPLSSPELGSPKQFTLTTSSYVSTTNVSSFITYVILRLSPETTERHRTVAF
jgi:hypothetical protein